MRRSSIIAALAAAAVLAGLLPLFWEWENRAGLPGAEIHEPSGNGGARPAQASDDPSAFITTWKTTPPNELIVIPVSGAAGSYTVLWGDGANSTSVAGDQRHRYRHVGTYTVAVTGDFERIYLNGDPANAPKLQSIEQ